MIKNLLVAAIAVLFSIAANAASTEVTTKDGTMTFEVAEDNTVTNKDGSAAKDGEYTLADGTTLTVKDGKKEVAAAPAAAPAVEAPAAK